MKTDPKNWFAACVICCAACVVLSVTCLVLVMRLEMDREQLSRIEGFVKANQKLIKGE